MKTVMTIAVSLLLLPGLAIPSSGQTAAAAPAAQTADARTPPAPAPVGTTGAANADYRLAAGDKLRLQLQTARLVAQGRLADANGDLAGAAKAYDDAVFIEDTLAYMEPPYWYYPIRQSLGSVMLRQGKLDDAEKLFRDSLGRVRNNGWALAGLAETYRRKGDAKAENAARRAFAKATNAPSSCRSPKPVRGCCGRRAMRLGEPFAGFRGRTGISLSSTSQSSATAQTRQFNTRRICAGTAARLGASPHAGP